MKLKVLILVIILSIALPTIVLAQGETPADPVGVFNDLYLAVAGAAGVAFAITILLQIGKLIFPKAFPDGSVDNWRLGIVLVVAIVLYFGPNFGLIITVADLDAVAQSLGELGQLLLPLFILLADWLSKTFFQKLLRGRLGIVGKSTTMTRKKIALQKKERAARG